MKWKKNEWCTWLEEAHEFKGRCASSDVVRVGVLLTIGHFAFVKIHIRCRRHTGKRALVRLEQTLDVRMDCVPARCSTERGRVGVGRLDKGWLWQMWPEDLWDVASSRTIDC